MHAVLEVEPPGAGPRPGRARPGAGAGPSVPYRARGASRGRSLSPSGSIPYPGYPGLPALHYSAEN